MYDAVSETTPTSLPRNRFQFSLRGLMIFSILAGAGVMVSPLGTLGVVIFIVLPAMLIESWLRVCFYFVVSVLLIGALLPTIAVHGHPRRRRIASKHLENISMALERYYADFHAYPPEDRRSTDSAESLAAFLCQPILKNGKMCGPYIQWDSYRLKDSDGDGRLELYDIWERRYFYGLKSAGTPLVIDPGKDGLLGGTFSKEKGFVPDGSDADRDGDPDDKDNLYSTLNGR